MEPLLTLLTYAVDPDSTEEELEDTEDVQFFESVDQENEERIISNIINQNC